MSTQAVAPPLNEVLLRAKREWERTFDAVPDLVALVDLEHRFVRVNRALATWLGLPFDRIIGRKCFELLHGLAEPPASCPHQLMLADGQTHSSEESLAGRPDRFLVTCSPLLDEHGRLAGSVHLCHDTSAQRRAEERLHRQNDYLTALHETALTLMSRRDLSQLLRSIVKRAMELFQASHGWIALVENERLVLKVGLGGLLASVGHAFQKGEGLSGRVWLSGEILTCADHRSLSLPPKLSHWDRVRAVAVVPIKSEGQVLGVFGLAREEGALPFDPEEVDFLQRFGELVALAIDNARLHGEASRELGERRQAEEALQWELMVNSALARLANQLLTPTLSQDDTALMVLEFAQGLTGSRHGYVGSINEQTRALECHTFSLMMQRECRVQQDQHCVSFPPEPGGAYPGLWGHCLNTRRPFLTNEPSRHPLAGGLPPGHVPLTALLCLPVLLRGQVAGQIALANPGRPYVERDLLAVGRLGELYALAIQRLRDQEERLRLEAQLRQSQKMEALGTFAGGIAHDFNNVLGSILGFTEMALLENQEGRSAVTDLQEVVRACQRAKDLVSRILTFSRRGRDERVPCRLALVVREALKLLRATLPATIHIEQEFTAPRTTALVDPTQIHQVVMNLGANAVQALGLAGGCLRVGLHERRLGEREAAVYSGLQPGPYLELIFSDNGPGMNQATLERAFEPFFTTKKGLGTGLGLAVVHGIVKAHRGAVTAESAPGQGATFRVLLPLVEEAPRQEEEPPLALPRGSERVMVVDDEGALLAVVARMLTGLGYQVEAFGDSREALARLRARPLDVDLLLTDQTMPGLTGAQLAAEALALRPDLPVVVCTGHTEALTPQLAQELGIRRMLMKPLSQRRLAVTLREVLEPTLQTP